jgi:uncharacterized Zn-binding protein involved in type VI secretion
MPPVSRLGDPVQHGCYGEHTLNSGSGNVFANGIPMSRVGDTVTVHCCGPACHSGAHCTGSAKVFTNGKPQARIGDPIDCGSIIVGGSGNVFAN